MLEEEIKNAYQRQLERQKELNKKHDEKMLLEVQTMLVAIIGQSVLDAPIKVTEHRLIWVDGFFFIYDGQLRIVKVCTHCQKGILSWKIESIDDLVKSMGRTTGICEDCFDREVESHKPKEIHRESLLSIVGRMLSKKHGC